MLSITYHVIPKLGAEPIVCVASGTLFESAVSTPPWLDDMKLPEQSSPLELWSPIVGDREHVVHIKGQVSYWDLPAAEIEPLLVTAEDGEAAQYREFRKQFPDRDYHWMIRSESRQHKRVPRTDARYQEQVQATIRAGNDD